MLCTGQNILAASWQHRLKSWCANCVPSSTAEPCEKNGQILTVLATQHLGVNQASHIKFQVSSIADMHAACQISLPIPWLPKHCCACVARSQQRLHSSRCGSLSATRRTSRLCWVPLRLHALPEQCVVLLQVLAWKALLWVLHPPAVKMVLEVCTVHNYTQLIRVNVPAAQYSS